MKLVGTSKSTLQVTQLDPAMRLALDRTGVMVVQEFARGNRQQLLVADGVGGSEPCLTQYGETIFVRRM